jgi:hypothetical protein
MVAGKGGPAMGLGGMGIGGMGVGGGAPPTAAVKEQARGQKSRLN